MPEGHLPVERELQSLRKGYANVTRQMASLLDPDHPLTRCFEARDATPPEDEGYIQDQWLQQEETESQDWCNAGASQLKEARDRYKSWMNDSKLREDDKKEVLRPLNLRAQERFNKFNALLDKRRKIFTDLKEFRKRTESIDGDAISSQATSEMV